jgi:hypothetical protein
VDGARDYPVRADAKGEGLGMDVVFDGIA